MQTAPATTARTSNALTDIGVAAFPSLAGAALADIDDDVDRFIRLVCGASDYASGLLRRRRAALLFPNVAGAPLKSRESEGVVRIGAQSVAYYHLVTAPSMRRTDPFGLAIFFPKEGPSLWQDYRIPFGLNGLVSSLGLEGARLLRIRAHH